MSELITVSYQITSGHVLHKFIEHLISTINFDQIFILQNGRYLRIIEKGTSDRKIPFTNGIDGPYTVTIVLADKEQKYVENTANIFLLKHLL